MLFSLPEYTQRLRYDLRLARIHTQTLIRFCDGHKKKIEELTNENKRLTRENGKLKKDKEKLKEEIEKLTKTKNRYQISLFDHGNFKRNQQKGKKPSGGQIGHADTNSDKQRHYSSFLHKRIFAKSCGTCGKSLLRAKGVKEKILIDIQLNTSLLQMILESERQWCRNCKQEVRSSYPQSLPFTEYGMNTFMTVLFLRFKGKQSHKTIATTLMHLFGLSISRSGIGALLNQAKEYLREKYEALKQAVRNGDIMYNDETGWRVKGKSAWMWIMANENVTVYVAAESRGKGIMEEIYENSKSYSMHDGYAGYTNTIPEDKQLYCWAHILRFIHEETILSPKGSLQEKIKKDVVRLYQTIRSHPEWTGEQKQQLLTQSIDEILSLPQKNQTIKNIIHRLKTQRDGLIRALLVTTDGTNNLAERELRPLAISRNISYGSTSYSGMETTAILASITQTITRDTTKQYLPTLKTYLQEGIQKKYPNYKHPPSFVT